MATYFTPNSALHAGKSSFGRIAEGFLRLHYAGPCLVQSSSLNFIIVGRFFRGKTL